MKKIWPVILILGLVLALPSLAWAEDEPATYNFASAQEDSSLTITASDTETYSHIYFYNVDGNRITHITLEVAQAPEGWEVEIDPPLHDQQVSFGGDIITVTENLYAEPTELAFEEIEDVPEGMVCLTLPNRGPTPEEPGYCLAKKVTITITVPESVEVNTSNPVEILATAAWLGQTGAAAVAQTRDFDFTVRTVYEVTDETIITGGEGFDVGRWLPVIIAVAIVIVAAILLPRFSRRRAG